MADYPRLLNVWHYKRSVAIVAPREYDQLVAWAHAYFDIPAASRIRLYTRFTFDAGPQIVEMDASAYGWVPHGQRIYVGFVDVFLDFLVRVSAVPLLDLSTKHRIFSTVALLRVFCLFPLSWSPRLTWSPRLRRLAATSRMAMRVVWSLLATRNSRLSILPTAPLAATGIILPSLPPSMVHTRIMVLVWMVEFLLELPRSRIACAPGL